LVLGDITAYGGQISGSYLMAFGGRLPGTEGGTWHGIGVCDITIISAQLGFGFNG